MEPSEGEGDIPPKTARPLSDAEIATMSSHERRELIRRLRVLDERAAAPRPELLRLYRRFRLGALAGGSVAMIPWIVFLAVTLPTSYNARNWSVVWVGFDVLLVAMMAATAYLGGRHRQVVMLPAFGTGLLLLVDAWFDIMTSGSRDVWISVGTAVLGEIPLGVLLIASALLIFRFLILSHPLHDPVKSPWRMKMPF
ncbi:hypothetical protein K7711_43640 [Nocardia sp. CA2R105]|uniref:hypothetical protein n=1 Tax=Nocardia coffeae TaxID=2873381 RepID=UPI001CA703BB|nr:hypothetical protein [Nocardia coffeae]MBY8863425.1 hypothetical protein [Nocardia coffeae]